MKSLRDISLSRYSYEEIKDLCYTEGNNFSNIFDCEWDVWRDKAHADFGVPPEFFDLIRDLPGPQRYLQIKSYFTLTPDLAVRVYGGAGYIEGVYEAEKGLQVAVEGQKLNMEMGKFFASLLIRHKKNSILDNINYKGGYMSNNGANTNEIYYYLVTGKFPPGKKYKNEEDFLRQNVSPVGSVSSGIEPFSYIFNREKNRRSRLLIRKDIQELILRGVEEALDWYINYILPGDDGKTRLDMLCTAEIQGL